MPVYTQARESGSRIRKPITPGNIKMCFTAIFCRGPWRGLPINAFWHPKKVIFEWLKESIWHTWFKQIPQYLHIPDPRINAFEPIVELKIPQLINNYNHYIGRVDIAN